MASQNRFEGNVNLTWGRICLYELGGGLYCKVLYLVYPIALVSFVSIEKEELFVDTVNLTLRSMKFI